MAFWGVEVKPGQPTTHKCDQARGRLRISQATLGSGDDTEASRKSVVQCNVGDRMPVLLCVLLPGKTESSHLDLEFEEADDVVFSVLGPRSVYLTGYFVRQTHRSNNRSDTESYGEDINNSQLDGSNCNGDDDKYEDSFINDEEVQYSPRFPALCIDEGLDEVTPQKARKKKRKPMVIESDSDMNSPKKEDEVDFSSSPQEVLKGLKTNTRDIEEKVAKETVEMDYEANDDGVYASETKHNADPLDISDKIERKTQSPLDEEGAEVNNVKNELPKLAQSVEKIMVSSQEEIRGSNTSETAINQNLPMINGEDQMQSLDLLTQSPMDEEGAEVDNVKNEVPKQVGSSEKIMVSRHEEIRESNTSEAHINQNLPMINGEDRMQSLDLAKPKNKRKKRSLTDKTCKAQTDNEDPSVPRGHKELEIDSSNLVDGEDHMVGPELDLENAQKSKKRRNELLEGELTQVTDEKFQDTTEENLSKQDSLHADGVEENLPDHMVAPEFDLENGQKSKKSWNELLEGELTHRTDKKIQDITGENLLKQDSLHADGMVENLPVASGEYEQQKPEETIMENFGPECQKVLQEAANGENQKDQIDRNIRTISEFQASDSQPGKKLKKKRKKTQGNADLNTSATQMSGNLEDEDRSAKTVPIHAGTLSNELIVEELERGPQSGKVAVPGKRVKIRFTGTLKESGHVFDSNKVCKFRLGVEEFIDGWNVGINGMHVGDKRRLTIPPSMGFGEEGMEKIVPPNSWLIYDIELVSVRSKK